MSDPPGASALWRPWTPLTQRAHALRIVEAATRQMGQLVHYDPMETSHDPAEMLATRLADVLLTAQGRPALKGSPQFLAAFADERRVESAADAELIV